MPQRQDERPLIAPDGRRYIARYSETEDCLRYTDAEGLGWSRWFVPAPDRSGATAAAPRPVLLPLAERQRRAQQRAAEEMTRNQEIEDQQSSAQPCRRSGRHRQGLPQGMNKHGGRSMPVTIPSIPRNATVRNRVIADAIRVCLSDCYADLFNDYETKFLLSLFHAHPDYVLSQRQGRLIAKLFERTTRADWRLSLQAWHIAGRY
jgi:hypothetical protein